LSIIAFVGSVFSPYYASAFARRGNSVDPDNHCAINVALYGAAGKRWAMTERTRAAVQRDRRHFGVGPSNLHWHQDHLSIHLDEVCAPFPFRIRGEVRIFPKALCSYVAALDDAGHHRWGPIAPCARVEVDLERPQANWKGQAYLDSNEGDEPVTRPFNVWDWSRASLADGSTAVMYDVRQTNGSERVIAQRFTPQGMVHAFEAPPRREALPSTFWRIKRSVRSDAGSTTRVLETLEDAPFYARSLLQTQLLGESVTAVHETLQPQRLTALPMRWMLPWRMPRRVW
jgi:carotenoid 1,2-hydratase